MVNNRTKYGRKINLSETKCPHSYYGSSWFVCTSKRSQYRSFDKIFSRVGASDDLAKGQSTFMIEMIETSLILNTASEKSLVILDEIGRGTATFDGLAIAWSVLDYLHNKIKPRTLFATHYHELTSLKEDLNHLSCHKMSIKEWNNSIIFMHKIIEGEADKSTVFTLPN